MRWFWFICAMCWLLPATAAAPSEPVVMQVNIFLNKIYNVDTLDETYTIDGYLVAQWHNQEIAADASKRTYENADVDALVASGFWLPALEFINVVGSPEISSKRLVLLENGMVIFNSRFLATFTTIMDFRRFPFDQQNFVLQLEPFSYPLQQLSFGGINVSAESLSSEQPGEWRLQGVANTAISSVSYSHLIGTGAGSEQYSRITVSVLGERNPSYYLWTFFLPLSLIIAASWAIFWLDNFSDRLQTSFTLMLTVVAYAFYTSNILPRLPYTTLIEQLVITGYCSIFAAVLLVLYVQHQSNNGHNAESLLRRCRLAFPSGVCLVVGILCWRQLSI
jgi:hypothetical protein